MGNGNVFTGEVQNQKPIGNGTFTTTYGHKYTGYFEDGKMTGIFVVEYASGSVYKGDVDDEGIREGKGVYNFASGSKYEGEWINGDMTGHGIYYWTNGNKYVGEFRNSSKTGHGIFYWADGDKYDGEWRNDYKTGQGIMYHASGNTYEGEFNQGNYNGWGTYIYKTKGNYAEYDGEWINDDRTGYGKMVYTDGSIYNGQWSNKKREGEGLLLWPNGTCFFGQMKNNEIYHGMTMTPDMSFFYPPYKNETFNRKGFKVVNFTSVECCPDNYNVGDTITVGLWKIMDGFGEFGINGGFYIGEMKQGIQTGFGLKSEPFLPTLIGTFKDGKLEGIGASISYSAKHRVVYFGGYKMGKPDGPGIFIYPDGEKVLGYFNKGKLDHTKKPIYLHADGTRDSLVTVNP